MSFAQSLLHRRCAGFTLLEVMMVLVIVTLAAVVAVPALSTNDTSGLELASTEVVEALRFARGEAVRSGMPHGVELTVDHRVRVFSLDPVPVPPVKQFNVRHPIDKSLYDVDLFSMSLTEGTQLSPSFLFTGSGTPQPDVAFDSRGEPIATANLNVLTSGSVTVTRHARVRTVALGQFTGRVTVSE